MGALSLHIKDNKGIWICLVVSLVLLMQIVLSVPPYMDEFATYRRIMCWAYPGNMLNVFRESCQAYDLDFLGTGLILPLRTQQYMGSIISLPYLPLFLIWKDPVTVRILGLIYLAFQAWIISRITQVKAWKAFLFLVLCFPYFFQHVVDTGVVGLQCSLLLATILMLKRYGDTGAGRYLLGAAALAFFGVWAKVIFICYALALVLIIFLNLKKGSTRHNVIWLTLSLLLFFALLSTLLFSPTPSGRYYPYLAMLFGWGGGGDQTMLDIVSQSKSFEALWNPFVQVHRFFEPASKSFLFIILYSVVTYGTVLYATWKDPKSNWKFLAAFVSALVIISTIPRTWAAHHSILAFPFLLMIVIQSCHLLPRWLIASNIIINLSVFALFPEKQMTTPSDWSVNSVNKVLNSSELASRYIYVVTDWGMYFMQALYGDPSQSVLYIEPNFGNDQLETFTRQINQAKAIAEKTNRSLLFIVDEKGHHGRRKKYVMDTFSLNRCQRLDPSQRWQVYYTEPKQPFVNDCAYVSIPDSVRVVSVREEYGDARFNQNFDGSPLRMRGIQYAYGIGAHANSEIRLRRPDGATVFSGKCGVADSGIKGNLDCQVFGDDTLLFKSSALTVNSSPASFEVNISSFHVITLKNTDLGSNQYDHVNWVDLKFEADRSGK